jgi:hypothetical protein
LLQINSLDFSNLPGGVRSDWYDRGQGIITKSLKSRARSRARGYAQRHHRTTSEGRGLRSL